MDNVGGILIFDEVSYVRHRISTLLQEHHFQTYEATYDMEVYNLLADDDIKLRLILMDLGTDVNNGIEVLSKIKERRPDIPIIIVTSNNKRQTFLQCLSEGATDYILKPFEDEFLIEKVLSVMQHKTEEKPVPERFVFDINNYLKTELKKASKGKYSLTILMCTLVHVEEEGILALEGKYAQAISSFYQIVLKSIWDTDIFERYGSQTFVGVFPYCNSKDAEKIMSKLQASYDNILSEFHNITPLRLAVASLTAPAETTEPKQLLLTLAASLEDKVEQLKKKVMKASKSPFSGIFPQKMGIF